MALLRQLPFHLTAQPDYMVCRLFSYCSRLLNLCQSCADIWNAHTTNIGFKDIVCEAVVINQGVGDDAVAVVGVFVILYMEV